MGKVEELSRVIGFDLSFMKLGDCVAGIKGLYAASCLYPQSQIVVFTTQIGKNLLKNYNFLNEIIAVESSGDEKDSLLHALQARKVDILILMFNKAWRAKAAKASGIPTIIAFMKFPFILSKQFQSPFYYKRQFVHMSEQVLNLVRRIDVKHYDKEIPQIDFSQCRLQTSDSNKAVVESFLKSCQSMEYSKIVGINFFGASNVTGDIRTFNFSLEDWISLAQSLSQEFPQILFILTTYQTNPIKLEINESQNLKVFCNNAEILNLVELISRLDLFVSVNTGNVHIADNLRIPTLAISRGDRYQKIWSGGSYGGEFDAIYLPQDWEENYQGYLERFYQLVRVKIQNNLQS